MHLTDDELQEIFDEAREEFRRWLMSAHGQTVSARYTIEYWVVFATIRFVTQNQHDCDPEKMIT